MHHRIKSLLYLIGFIIAAMMYNHLQEEPNTKKETVTVESNEKAASDIAGHEY